MKLSVFNFRREVLNNYSFSSFNILQSL
jgi:hypothetical protein